MVKFLTNISKILTVSNLFNLRVNLEQLLIYLKKSFKIKLIKKDKKMKLIFFLIKEKTKKVNKK